MEPHCYKEKVDRWKLGMKNLILFLGKKGVMDKWCSSSGVCGFSNTQKEQSSSRIYNLLEPF